MTNIQPNGQPLEAEIVSPMKVISQPTQNGGLQTGVSQALAVQARAQVEARFQVALMNPRSWDTVRQKVLTACKRTSFAEVARYQKPIGGSKVVGPSIRFAEEVIRCMGNLEADTAVIHDDADQRLIRITVTDLESNVTYPTDVLIRKVVERSSLKEGQHTLGQRVNSSGKNVYLVEATEDDLQVKAAALASKALRTSSLRLFPGDILDEAMETVKETLRRADEQDPAAARKKICDAFWTLGVKPEDLVAYLEHQLDQCTPAELQELRNIFAAMKDGEARWADVMGTKAVVADPKKPEGGGTRSEKLLAKLKAPKAETKPTGQPKEEKAEEKKPEASETAKAEGPKAEPAKAETKPTQTTEAAQPAGEEELPWPE